MEIKITREEFQKYEECRQSGVTNMNDTGRVQMITGLDAFTIRYIILNYNKLRKQFEGENNAEQKTT